MSKISKNRCYRQRKYGKSLLDGNPTLILNRYWVPKQYRQPVAGVLSAFRSGTSFNKSVDQVAVVYGDAINRNKLAEHTLKTIANDY